MLSNLLSLVIIVCIHRIKDTKRWFRESPTEQGDSNPCFPTATSVPQGEVLILWLLHRVEEKKKIFLLSLALWQIHYQFQRIHFSPYLVFLIQKLIGLFKKHIKEQIRK